MLLATAYRNLWRNRRRTQLTLSAMILSSSLLILALGIFSGMLDDMLASATEQYHGHVVISARGYQDSHDLYATLDPVPLLEILRRRPEILGFSPRLRGFGLASGAKASRPVELLGVDPGAEVRVTTLSHQLEQGAPLNAGGTGQALIGRGLAEKLGLKVGDSLVLFTQAADGSLANDLLRITGIFATGDSRRDNNLVLCQLAWLQNFLVLPGRVHEISLRIADPLEAEKTAAALRTLVDPELEILDWGRLLPEMREAVASFDVSRMIIVLILYAATALGILNTFFMSVLERSREFGILSALGMRPRRILSLILLEAGLLGLIGLAGGTALGLLLTWPMAAVGIDLSATLTAVTYGGGTILPRLHAEFVAANFWLPALSLFLVSLAAGLPPARRAARLKPVEALRHD
ncbi:ABC-type lipoprotein release transport system permease subunit [Geothermobacter ehrlichii]|uniref:ABC-type lipoprotein release transport system permease subunit n=1 Tax=Geothermobacter ehrlichii TaxID=213224 RepID=A0A5D3WII7_9BACT|nr:FtsX-like permease family protein [Geothermobacter ehrlichii]TYO98689.1 ABC-type lipoprotein release transport system permease subunit [Geothermobacter ehrlichii]